MVLVWSKFHEVALTHVFKIVLYNNPTFSVTICFLGMVYPPGVIKEGFDENSWCYKVICQDNGQLYLWGDWDCKRKSTTATPLETTPTAPKACKYNGKFYPVGEITRGSDASGWCYGVMCKNDGQIVLWGSFTCNKI